MKFCTKRVVLEYVLGKRDPTLNTARWTDPRAGGQTLKCLERLSTGQYFT